MWRVKAKAGIVGHMVDVNTLISKSRLIDFCRRWKVTRVELFGSALREDFSANSDVDFLVTFEEGGSPDFFAFARMQRELEALIGRRVDVMTRRAVEQSPNPERKREILDSVKTIYEEKAA
jgi:predicted nucleotidyltransferase